MVICTLNRHQMRTCGEWEIQIKNWVCQVTWFFSEIFFLRKKYNCRQAEKEKGEVAIFLTFLSVTDNPTWISWHLASILIFLHFFSTLSCTLQVSIKIPLITGMSQHRGVIKPWHLLLNACFLWCCQTQFRPYQSWCAKSKTFSREDRKLESYKRGNGKKFFFACKRDPNLIIFHEECYNK